MARKIIIDTDPGQDDAVAILLALASTELEVLGLTAVAGNVPLALTHTNARRILELADRAEVPVCAGASRPMVRPLVTAEHVHGRTGLDGADLPDPTVPLHPQHGVDFIVETLLMAEPGEVTLCTLGPLTNVALALQRAPEIATRIREIVMMGGAYFEVGNITPAAEFNIYVDPHAADVVFRSGVPLTVLPLDVTHKVVASPARLAPPARPGQPIGRGRGRDARLLRALRHAEIRAGGRAAARPERHRLAAQAGPLHRTPHQRRDRDRESADPRHDGRGLLAG